ncbi:hypothetical protein BJV82DRAFT_593166 [Fennellomyces sp. T-0311]|nr:hypothetical protein BJV82DRAFT_593166 [Fennellomyces sp. T-0311]
MATFVLRWSLLIHWLWRWLRLVVTCFEMMSDPKGAQSTFAINLLLDMLVAAEVGSNLVAVEDNNLAVDSSVQM